jgi:hypothetical protein
VADAGHPSPGGQLTRKPQRAFCAPALRAERTIRHAAGVTQARRTTRLRQDALRDPGSAELAAKVRRGARNAAALRATIAALSLALLALGTVIAT